MPKNGIPNGRECHVLSLGEETNQFEKVCLLIRERSSLWTGLGKSGYAAMLLAATAATCSLQARYVHSEDLLHGELSGLREEAVLIAVSWSGQSEQIREVIARAPSVTVLMTSNRASLLEVAPDYGIEVSSVADSILSGIPAESIMELLRVGYSLIAGATTHAERRAALLSGHPHGALARRSAQSSAELVVQYFDSSRPPDA